jgi:hypothetical protein
MEINILHIRIYSPKWIDEFIEEISVFVRVVVLYIGYWIILAARLKSCWIWEYLYAMVAAIKNMDSAVTWPRYQTKKSEGSRVPDYTYLHSDQAQWLLIRGSVWGDPYYFFFHFLFRFLFVDFVLLSLVSFYFVFISLISFRFVSFLLISFRFRWFRFVSSSYPPFFSICPLQKLYNS